MKFIYQDVVYEFSADCLAALAQHRQRAPLSRENGGQLFARFEQDRIFVETATTTRGRSRRLRFGFWPDRDAERADIQALFKDGLHYVGDWHSHPESRPRPSQPDESKMREIFDQSKHELLSMLLVIVGQDEFPAGLFVGAVAAGGVTELACLR